MTTKHTPGPWEVDGEYVQPAGQDGLGICSVLNMDEGGDKDWFSGPITAANARLIAAAPELLLGAMRYLNALDTWDGSNKADRHTKRMEIGLRAAVAKAKGEQR